jgi:hypothetical protein
MKTIEVGDKVWWEYDGYVLSGEVKALPSFATDWKVMVLTDCGKVNTFVWIEELKVKPAKENKR